MASEKYDYEGKDFLLWVEGYSRDGYNEAQIAETLDLCPQHFSKLKGKYPKIDEAIKRGRKPLDIVVENSLYRRAIGLKVKKVVREWKIIDGHETPVEVVRETEEELPPDTGAAMAWLKQRKPEQWNKQPDKVALTDPSGEKEALMFLSSSDMSRKQLDEYVKMNLEGDVSNNNSGT